MKSIAKPSTAKWLLPLSLLLFSILSCRKEEQPKQQTKEIATETAAVSQGRLQQTKTFSSDFVVDWVEMQLQMQKLPLNPVGQATDRCQAYCGIALYESVVPGMPAYQTLHGQLNDFPAMPSTEPGKAYHWAASANAALAEMNKRLFPTTAQVNKDAMNSLENSWAAIFAAEVDAATLERSIAFGREVASRVFNWAATDGSANPNTANPPIPLPGLWVPISPAPLPGAGYYAHQRRKLVPGVANGTALDPPPAYSTSIGSEFYNMAHDVFSAVNNITADQRAATDYFKDVPGFSPGGTYVSLMSQILDMTKPTLDLAALTYVKVGIAQYDATVILFTDKYHFYLIRPLTYIKNNIDAGWSTIIPTPNHPEFPSGHSTTGGAVLGILTSIYGDNFNITLHTYDYLGYPTRSYTSFTQLGTDISDSRFWSGLHYMPTLTKSYAQGRKVAENVLATVKFLKDE